MKRQIFLYLFLFAVLLLIFQYMNEKSIFESQEKQIESLRTKNEQAEKTLDSIRERAEELNYFTLQGNDNAMTYLEELGFNPVELETYITDQIFDKNIQEKNNPLVPYDGMNNGMKINKIKFLNHKWILANFTDGSHWGETILEYSVSDNGDLHFQNLGALIYPQ